MKISVKGGAAVDPASGMFLVMVPIVYSTVRHTEYCMLVMFLCAAGALCLGQFSHASDLCVHTCVCVVLCSVQFSRGSDLVFVHCVGGSWNALLVVSFHQVVLKLMVTYLLWVTGVCPFACGNSGSGNEAHAMYCLCVTVLLVVFSCRNGGFLSCS